MRGTGPQTDPETGVILNGKKKMVKTIEQILEENALAFSPNMEPHYMAELEEIWNDACRESGGDVTDAQIDE